MIIEPGWYLYKNGTLFMIFRVFEYFPKGSCWSFNTLLCTREIDDLGLGEEDALAFEGSSLHDMSEQLSDGRNDELFDFVFNSERDVIIGKDYI